MQNQVSIAVEQYNEEQVKVTSYIKSFIDLYQRPPTKEEIEDYFTNENSGEITDQSLFKYLDGYNDTEYIGKTGPDNV